MKFYLSIILLEIWTFAFGQTHPSVSVTAPTTKQTIEQVLETQAGAHTEPLTKEDKILFYTPAVSIEYSGDFVPMKMVHTYKGLAIHPDIIAVKEGESVGYMFLCREPEYKRFDIYVNERSPDFGFYSIGPDTGIYPCEIRDVKSGVSIIYHHEGRFLVAWEMGFIFDGANTYKL